MSDEQDIQNMIAKIKQLQEANPSLGQPQNAQIPVNPNPIPGNKPGLFDNQGSVTDFANTAVQSGNPQQAANTGLNATGNVCHECGKIHPPIQEGQKCPNSSIEKQTGIKIDDGQVNQFLVQWRNIILSEISKSNIEKWKDEFQQITMIIQKYFDEKKEVKR